MSLMLSSLLTTLKPLLQTKLPGWNISSDEIKWPEDKLVELLYLNFQSSYVDFDTVAYSGVLAIVLYKEYKTSYTDQIDAVETVMDWLPTLNIANFNLGNDTANVAQVATSIVTDGGQGAFRANTISIPFQLIQE